MEKFFEFEGVYLDLSKVSGLRLNNQDKEITVITIHTKNKDIKIELHFSFKNKDKAFEKFEEFETILFNHKRTLHKRKRNYRI